MPRGWLAEPAAQLVADAARDEMLDGAGRIEHPQRGVFGIGQLANPVDDDLEHRVEVEHPGDAAHGCVECLQPSLRQPGALLRAHAGQRHGDGLDDDPRVSRSGPRQPADQLAIGSVEQLGRVSGRRSPGNLDRVQRRAARREADAGQVHRARKGAERLRGCRAVSLGRLALPGHEGPDQRRDRQPLLRGDGWHAA